METFRAKESVAINKKAERGISFSFFTTYSIVTI
jgi:hypothetical protein